MKIGIAAVAVIALVFESSPVSAQQPGSCTLQTPPCLTRLPAAAQSDYKTNIRSALPHPNSKAYTDHHADLAEHDPKGPVNFLAVGHYGDDAFTFNHVSDKSLMEQYAKHILIVNSIDYPQTNVFVRTDGWSESDGVDPNIINPNDPLYHAAVGPRIPDVTRIQNHFIQSGLPGNRGPFDCDFGNPNCVSYPGPDPSPYADRHLNLYNSETNEFWEFLGIFYDPGRNQWTARQASRFDATDLNSMHSRPLFWTSSEASGMAEGPGIMTYDELYNTDKNPNFDSDIGHGVRIGIGKLAWVNGFSLFVYPASHAQCFAPLFDPSALPMGARLRLSKDFNVNAFPATLTDGITPDIDGLAMRRFLTTLQNYGFIVVDGTQRQWIEVDAQYDRRWNSKAGDPQGTDAGPLWREAFRSGNRPGGTPYVQHWRDPLPPYPIWQDFQVIDFPTPTQFGCP